MIPVIRLPRLKLATLGKLGELALTNVATFAFPLVFAVVCGRTLGLNDYGVLSFYTALAAFIGMFIEFGLDWHGIREVAQRRDDKLHCSKVLWHVTAAKIGLLGLAVLVAGAGLCAARGVAEWPMMIGSAAYLVGFALDVSWFLRATEHTRLLLAITTGARLFGIACLLLLMSQQASIERALWVYAIVSMVTSGLAWASLLRLRLMQRVAIEQPRVLELLRRSWTILLGNMNGALLTNGGVALLGFIADPATVGAAGLALRVRSVGQAMLLPIQQLGFVRISGLARDRPAEAVAVGRRLLWVTLPAALLITGGMLWLAPEISRFVFTEEVPLATLMMMLLALSLPIQAVGNLYGLQSLIAFGKERVYAAVQMLASLAFGLVVLAHTSDAYGWAVLAAETVVMLVSGWQLVRVTQRLKP